jgi:L-ascorbate 6-phosphate lactonase
MSTFARAVESARVPEGCAALWWLAQAGFVFKNSSGTVLYVDAYLSDAVEKAFGFKRLSLPPIEAEDVRADWYVSSHEHLDHLDVDTLPVVARNNAACRFAGTDACWPEYEKAAIPANRLLLLEAGKRYCLGGVDVFTARADHGELSPSALSLLFDFGKVRVLFTADTALHPAWMEPLIKLRPDILLTCINGRFGNLNAEEAAELTAMASPRAVVPCHFWMFKEHNGDPDAFVQACAKRCPNVPVRLMRPGEGLYCTTQAVETI